MARRTTLALGTVASLLAVVALWQAWRAAGLDEKVEAAENRAREAHERLATEKQELEQVRGEAGKLKRRLAERPQEILRLEGELVEARSALEEQRRRAGAHEEEIERLQENIRQGDEVAAAMLREREGFRRMLAAEREQRAAFERQLREEFARGKGFDEERRKLAASQARAARLEAEKARLEQALALIRTAVSTGAGAATSPPAASALPGGATPSPESEEIPAGEASIWEFNDIIRVRMNPVERLNVGNQGRVSGSVEIIAESGRRRVSVQLQVTLLDARGDVLARRNISVANISARFPRRFEVTLRRAGRAVRYHIELISSR